MPLRPNRPSAAIVLLLLAFAAMSRLFWGCFAEDSFIVARYCANLLRGNGLVFNPGERIDMLTSPLHALVLLPFEALFGNAIKAYSIACAIGVALLGAFAAKRLFDDGPRRALFVAGVLLFPPFCFWTVGGLETPILSALALALLIAWRAPGRTHAVAILAFAAAAILTRYDALLLVGPAALYTLARQRRERGVLLAAIVLAAIGAAWFAFCWRYYGDLLPTSFYTKNPGDWTVSGALRGALYELNLLVLFALPAAVALLFARRAPRYTHRGATDVRPDWPLLAGLALYFAYGFSAGVVHMMYLYRLFVPCLPWLFVLAIACGARRPRPAAIAVAVALQFVVAVVIYTRALNFNLTLFFKHQQPLAEVFEFSTIGARANKQTDKGFAAQARDLRAHWAAQPHAATAVPRLHSITEGQPPYELPGFYAFGPLASYRHDCHADTVASSHYLQHLDWLDEHGTDLFPWTQPGWQLVARMDIPVTEWSGVQRAIRLDWYYQPEPRSNPLPAAIHGDCVAGAD